LSFVDTASRSMQDGADKGESVTFEDERKKKQTWEYHHYLPEIRKYRVRFNFVVRSLAASTELREEISDTAI